MGKKPPLARPARRAKPIVATADGTAAGHGAARAEGTAIATGTGIATTGPKTKPADTKRNSKRKRKTYWDDSVDRILKEKFPDNDATNFQPKDVVKTVLDALESEIKQSGRNKPTRGLILRRSGH